MHLLLLGKPSRMGYRRFHLMAPRAIQDHLAALNLEGSAELPSDQYGVWLPSLYFGCLSASIAVGC